MSRLQTILMAPAMCAAGVTELIAMVEALHPVRFTGSDTDDGSAPAAVGELRVAPREHDAAASYALPGGRSLELPANRGPLPDQPFGIDLEFVDDPRVPFPFRGRTVQASALQTFAPLQLLADEHALARTAHGVAWSVREVGSRRHYRCAFPLPAVAPHQSFHDVFQGPGFLALLALLEFLRHAVDGLNQVNAPLRAAFIIDDPNLHWPRYGHVDYEELGRSAARGRYHVAFAMIPLDTWFTHPRAAELFRRSPDLLSLLVHGNNHAKRELARPYDEAERYALLAQATQRIASFERKALVQVDRVMVPPHGACTVEMLGALARAGFTAACISAGSLRAHNPDQRWTRTLGHAPCELIEGCPVMPRWAFGPRLEQELLRAAYLGQALIARAHHEDLKGGPDMIEQTARFINGLGPVQWARPGKLCRRSYRWRQQRSAVHITPFAPDLEVVLPVDAQSLVVEPPDAMPGSEWRADFGNGEFRRLVPDVPLLLPEGGRSVRLACAAPQSPGELRAVSVGTPAWLVVRRFLTEARDRLRLA